MGDSFESDDEIPLIPLVLMEDSEDSNEAANSQQPSTSKVDEHRTLYEHQIEAIHFMRLNCIDNDSGCIVAHHMGLGKTLSTIAFLNSVKNVCNKVLILTKKSIVGQWVAEFNVKYDTSQLGIQQVDHNKKFNIFYFQDAIR